MKVSSSRVLLIFTVLVATASGTKIKAAPEPMPVQEKETLVEGGGYHRTLRGLQTGLNYKGQICRSETKGVMACSMAGTECQPDSWDYYQVNLQVGIAYTIEVDRVTCNLDPALTLFEGFGTALPYGCFYSAGSAELTRIVYADDNNLEPSYCSEVVLSPFADPKIIVTPSTSGPFTLAVVNFASDRTSCRATAGYQYKVKVSPTPSCV